MSHDNKIRWAFLALCVALVLSAACTKSSTTSVLPTDPPQVQVEKYVNLAETANNSAAHALLVLCTAQANGKASLDAQTCQTTRDALTAAESAIKQVSAEANSADTWAVARVRIAVILSSVAIDTAVTDANLKAELTALQEVILKIAGVS